MAQNVTIQNISDLPFKLRGTGQTSAYLAPGDEASVDLDDPLVETALRNAGGRYIVVAASGDGGDGGSIGFSNSQFVEVTVVQAIPNSTGDYVRWDEWDGAGQLGGSTTGDLPIDLSDARQPAVLSDGLYILTGFVQCYEGVQALESAAVEVSFQDFGWLRVQQIDLAVDGGYGGAGASFSLCAPIREADSTRDFRVGIFHTKISPLNFYIQALLVKMDVVSA